MRIEGVEKLNERSDVWCIDVPDGAWFTLENGAVVHNSHAADAARTLGVAHKVTLSRPPAPRVRTLQIGGDASLGWLGS